MSLYLNFSAVDIADAVVEAQVLPYGEDGAEFLRELRQDHWQTHVFRRDGANTLLAIPTSKGAPELSSTHKTIKLQDSLQVGAALVRNALITYLHSLQRPVLKYDPIRFISTREDLLQDCLPRGIQRPPWLSLRILYEVAVRPIYFHKRKPFIAAIVDLRTTRRVDRRASELVSEGFSPVGHHVVRQKAPTLDERLQPGIELLGRVEGVSGVDLLLSDSRDGLTSIPAQEVLFERTAFEAVLQHQFAAETSHIRERLDKAKSELRFGPNRLAKIKAIVDHFTGVNLEIAPGIRASFSSLMCSSEQSFPSVDSAPKPTFVFDQAGSRTSSWSDGGIDRHGPYTSRVFTPTRPHLCVVCLKSNKGQIEQFLHKFLHGVSLPAGKNRNYFEKGLLRKYQLQDVTYEFFFADSQSAAAYKAACSRAVERHATTKFDLALVQIEESFHNLPITTNPYFITKESFLTHQIPVQEFEIETAQRPDRGLAICLNNMGLATYAKLNGIPWLLKGDPTIAHELVIGLGSAQIKENRLGEHERFVGITTVFSGDGNYHLSSASRAVPFESYTAAFAEALRGTIQKVRTDMNWRAKDHIRLIFHASFKRFSDFDTRIVQQLVSELSEYAVEYAFVEIHEDHPYLLFDDSAKGKMDFETQGVKGVYTPQRSTILHLSNRDTLLSLTGPGEVKRPQDGLPSPLLLTLHRCSTFCDMTYLTRQVFTFACHSWRTFLPASLPVTIQYSDLIARALGSLSQLDRWNPDVMIGRIGKTRWFL